MRSMKTVQLLVVLLGVIFLATATFSPMARANGEEMIDYRTAAWQLTQYALANLSLMNPNVLTSGMGNLIYSGLGYYSPYGMGQFSAYGFGSPYLYSMFSPYYGMGSIFSGGLPYYGYGLNSLMGTYNPLSYYGYPGLSGLSSLGVFRFPFENED